MDTVTHTLSVPLPNTGKTCLDFVRHQQEIRTADGSSTWADAIASVQTVTLRIPRKRALPGSEAADADAVLASAISTALWETLLPGMRPGDPSDPHVRCRGDVTYRYKGEYIIATVQAAAFEFVRFSDYVPAAR